MVATSSVTSLCNRALAQIGGKSQISNIQEVSAAAQACNLLFLPTYTQLARTAWWNCFRKQTNLTLLLAAGNTPENPSGNPPFPPSPWIYQYLIPPDCLKSRAVLPNVPAQSTGGPPMTSASVAAPLWIRGLGRIPFVVAYANDANNNPQECILTDEEQAQLLYTVNQPNPQFWDSQFEAAFVAALAAFLVPALSLHLPLMSLQAQVAERIIAEARASDGNEGPTSQDHTPDWIRARAGGALGWYNQNWAGPGWDSMAWPPG